MARAERPKERCVMSERMTAETVADKIREIQGVPAKKEKPEFSQKERDLIAGYAHILGSFRGDEERLFVATAIRRFKFDTEKRRDLDETTKSRFVTYGPPAFLRIMALMLEDFEVKKRN